MSKKSKTARFSAIIMALTMVMSLFSGISFAPVTAYAANEDITSDITIMVADSCQDDNNTVMSYAKSEYTVKEGVKVEFQCGKWWSDTVTIYLNSSAVATWAGADYNSSYTWTAGKDAKINWAGYSQSSANIYLTQAVTYDVTVSDSIDNGTVTSDKATATQGETVTLTVTPGDGYELDTLTVTDADNGTVTATQDSTDSSKYTFTMPAKAVTVNATFVAPTTNTPTYTVTIPATLEVANSGWNKLTGGIKAKGSGFSNTQKLSVTAKSANNEASKGWVLASTDTSNDATIGYNLVTTGDSDSTYSSTAEPASWEFSKTELTANEGAGTTKTAGIVVEDFSSKPAGSYEDTVTFTAEVVNSTSSYTLLSAATTADIGKVVCAAGHLHTEKTAVPDGCTAVGILGKVTETGHGLILALKNANHANGNTINGWESNTSYANTNLKVLPDDSARGSLTSYTTIGSTAVSNWAVAQKSDYEEIFTNLGSTTGTDAGKVFDDNVNAYLTTGVGGTAISASLPGWSATKYNDNNGYRYSSSSWDYSANTVLSSVRPVIGF